MGIVAVGICLALVAAFLWLMAFVVPPLTKPSTVAATLSKVMVKGYAANSESQEETVRLVIALDMAASASRLVTLQIALATVGGFFLVSVGVVLFAAGVSDMVAIDASHQQSRVQLSNLAPGMAAAVLGTILLLAGTLIQVPGLDMGYRNSINGRTEKSAASPNQSSGKTVTSNPDLPTDSWYFGLPEQALGDGI